MLDPERLELRRGEEIVQVQPQVFALMLFLIENRNRVVTKDEVIDNVWDGRIVSDGTLNARINAARRALGDTGEDQAVIKTFPRRGFRFVCDVGTDGAVAPAAVVNTDYTPVETPDTASIAVLPFTNLSGDPEQEYFADGLAEDLITDLSKITDLFVIAKHSAFTFKNAAANVTEIGERLGVEHVLEGSVRKAGNRVRITAQLVDANTGGHVWADRYDRDFGDIFALQDEITARIVSALKVSLSAGATTNRRTESVEAYELNLKGRATFFKFTPQANAECIALHQQAIAIDPNFADAWAGLVFPYQSGWSFIWPGYDDGMIIAFEKAGRAVALAPDSSFALSRLGWVQMFMARPDDSIASFEKSIKLDPRNADAYSWFCDALNFTGDPRRAIEIGETALRYDPLSPPNVVHHLGHAHFLLGHLDKAEELERRATKMVPAFPPARMGLAATLVELGRIDEAREQIARLREMHPQHNVQTFNERYPYHNPEHRQRVLEGLRAAGLPEN